MKLNLVRGLDQAGGVLTRFDPLDLDSLPQAVVDKTREVFGPGVTPEQSVHRIIEDVRRDGDAALKHYARALDGIELTNLRIPRRRSPRPGTNSLPNSWPPWNWPPTGCEKFHEAIMPRNWVDLEQGLGELVRPLERVGLYAPGGTAAYPSTVLMTAIPARVAGVKEVILVTPPSG